MKINSISSQIILIENFWDQRKCSDFIKLSESKGYEPATINTEFGPRVVDHIRNNNRVLFKDNNLADSLWLESKSFVPNSFGKSMAVGINELFRFYRYEPRQEFRRHRDGSFIRNETEASYYTVLIYLNNDFEGGETEFSDTVITPKLGSMLIFNHQLEHSGNSVLNGVKYVLRTDVMYKLIE